VRTRHKPPSLVSMWMLDVFCCALGCVTLLWLLNTRTATDQTARAASALTDLAASKAAVLALQADLGDTKAKLTAEVEDLKAKVVAVTAERDETARQLAVARTDVSSLETRLAKSATDAQTVRDELRKRTAAAEQSAAKLAAASQTSAELSQLLRKKEDELAAAAARIKEADDKLRDLDARLAIAEKKTGDAAAVRTQARDAEQKLAAATATIIDLQGEKKKLADKIDQLKTDADAKFAGIATTGKRVVLLVDVSGSMKLVDEKTPAPAKWRTVVETIGKILRSIPDLDQVQVVTFSRQAQYLFNTPDWLEYKGEATVAKISTALLAIDPVGDTNLFDALSLAFRLRPAGLDTIYLFSDGLPTSGPGMTADQDKLPEGQRTELLSKHIRRTLGTVWNPAGAGRVRVNAVGFFYESPEVGAFLWSLARENDGSFVGMSRP
jgi:von Willebrand factor type A domain